MSESNGPVVLGEGVLNWPSSERVSDRYGRVNIEGERGYVSYDPALEGQTGTLTAEIIEARESGHIGDLFRGIGPVTPSAGDVITLGTGTVFLSESCGAACIGLRPDDERESDWLDPRALYRCHNQTVRLTFTPEAGQ